MDITISVSDKAVKNIRAKADESGKPVEDFIEEFVESSFSVPAHNGDGSHDKNKPHPLMRMAGMFSSGVTDTSERMHEILYSENFDPAQGFGTDK